jgi:predicted small secreted protein
MRRGTGIVLLFLALGLSIAGCNQDQGTTVTGEDAAKIAAAQAAAAEKQIADIQADPKMSASQKKSIINTIRAGVARSAAGSQSGKASGTAPTK